MFKGKWEILRAIFTASEVSASKKYKQDVNQIKNKNKSSSFTFESDLEEFSAKIFFKIPILLWVYIES